jgi:putative addiction module CopG family antidote
MNLTFPKQIQEFIDDQVKSGAYATAEGVICAGVMALKQQHDQHDDEVKAGELDAMLAEGADAGEGEMSLDEAIRLRREERARRLRKGA